MAEANEPDSFAWDLLYSLYEKKLTDKPLVIILWCHYNLLRRGFKNAGMGEDLSLPNQSELRETLPDGWNDSSPCRLRYYFDKNLYTLTIHPVDDDGDVIINLSRPADNQLSVSALNTREVAKLNGRLEEILPEWIHLANSINAELIDPIFNITTSKDVPCQTETHEPPAGSRYPDITPVPSLPFMPRVHPFRPPLGIGSTDLDPLGGGGGMLFQPPGMGPRPSLHDPFLPRGSVPPGARFDPIMPGRGNRPRPFPPRGSYPDPDHLPPPGYDDMFS